jgi:hypothetical protein
MIFIERPISAALIAVTVGTVLLMAIPMIRRKRDVALQED